MERISKESAELMFPAQVKVYKVMLEQLAILREMANEWDGKVINKRFVTAFEKRFAAERGRISIDTMCCYLQIKHYVSESRTVNTPKGCFYVKDCDNTLYYGKERYIDDSRKLNAARFIEIIDNNVNHIKQRIADYEWCLEHYDEVREQTRQLDKQVKEFYDRIPRPLKPDTYRIENPFEYFLH